MCNCVTELYDRPRRLHNKGGQAHSISLTVVSFTLLWRWSSLLLNVLYEFLSLPTVHGFCVGSILVKMVDYSLGRENCNLLAPSYNSGTHSCKKALIGQFLNPFFIFRLAQLFHLNLSTTEKMENLKVIHLFQYS